ncbi:MAG: response regulator [Patescibacteria group bacterium]|nr:response regulator [Patescibacteria group bacterium]
MKHILLVEDDKQLAAMYAQKFRTAGFKVTMVQDGGTALERAKLDEYDGIVLDIMLPGISGVEILGILRSDPKTVKTPIVVYTNYGDKFNREKCLSYGADEFILKVDSTPESLCETINKVISEKEIEAV